ncbi:hypothetical protein [Candidatus Nitrosotenuis aquarius]|uniref:hypothetical protein n=1 Tax=Candidatus Nitrosotenuis aquarius TaxID=1846278 RepID=UPI000C1F92D7|nr:hypothetical protein [Candidatus Nitrosotenuis aquarius]
MLDDWMEKTDKKQEHVKSILSAEMITRYSLKERIVELEKMRDQILYELARLQDITRDKKL